VKDTKQNGSTRLLSFLFVHEAARFLCSPKVALIRDFRRINRSVDAFVQKRMKINNFTNYLPCNRLEFKELSCQILCLEEMNLIDCQ
jgi:hypothetical protein